MSKPQGDVIDVSHHNGTELHAGKLVREGIRCVVLRSGDGKTEDRRTGRWAGRLEGGTLDMAVYHYMRCDHGAAKNWDVVNRLISNMNTFCGNPLFVAADVEGGPSRSKSSEASGAWQDVDSDGVPCTTQEVVDVTCEFLKLVEGSGCVPVLYVGRSWPYFSVAQRQRLQEAAWGGWWRAVGHRQLQIPKWGDPILHQYTSKANIEGVQTPVDCNRRLPESETYEEWVESIAAAHPSKHMPLSRARTVQPPSLQDQVDSLSARVFSLEQRANEQDGLE